MDGTYEITDLNVTGAGKILKMKVNGKGVDVVTDITKNADDEITAISINGASQEIAGSSDIEENKEATIDVSTYTEPVEITPTEGKDGMAKATITLDNIPSGGDIETNKAATINVSTYTEPVEIEPTEGKDGMAKCTVTLSNIPSSGGTAYAWSVSSMSSDGVMYTNFDVAPDTEEEWFTKLLLTVFPNGLIEKGPTTGTPYAYTKTDDNTFVITSGQSYTATCTRNSNADLTLW